MFLDANLEKLKQITEMTPEIPVPEEAEDEEGEEQKQPEQPKEEEEDPNKDKFAPHFVHFDRKIEAFLTVSDLLPVFEYAGTLFNDHRFGIIFDDNYFETISGDTLDLFYGIGCGFLNVKGIQHQEKAAKVDRFAEIAGSLIDCQVVEEKPEEVLSEKE